MVTVNFFLVLLLGVTNAKQFFRVPIDHNDSSIGYWDLEYFTNDDYFEDGPAYLVSGGEGKTTPEDTTTSYIIELAKETQGIVYDLAHRCYSRNQDNKKVNEKYLNYCSSEQALLDFAEFIKMKNNDLPPGTKWITTGCSYAGRLAIQMRGRYPNLVHAALASSAPLVALYDFAKEYVEAVVKALAANCETDKPHFVDYKYVLDDYTPHLKGKCDILRDIRIIEAAGKVVQYNVNYNEYINTISLFCMVKGIYNCKNQANRMMLKSERRMDEDKFVWDHQLCTEFGWFAHDCPYHNSSNWSEKNLKKLIEQENKSMDQMLSSISRVLLVYGSIDIWTKSAPTESYAGVKRIDIPGGAHCSDWYTNINSFQDRIVAGTQQEILETIEQWLQEDNTN